DPRQIRRTEQSIDLARTLFVVASKSGTTLEPDVLMEYFLDRVVEAVGHDRAADRFVAITDPGSRLEALAAERGFRQIFLGSPGMGGRSAVRWILGRVPLAATGHEVRRFLEDTRAMVQACAADVPPAANPGVVLGVIMGVLARRGLDKITLVASPAMAT